MDENIQYLAEVLVKPEIKKNRTINPMAITGGRMISMEEAGRFANGFDDPRTFFPWFADAGEADHYIDSCAAIAAMAAVPA